MGNNLGSAERPLRVAIIGSGPAGFYSAEALLHSPLKVTVDMFDRLPTPFGLVRYGVAPDHPKIKNVIKVFEKTAQLPGFSFFGNVNVGTDIALAELREHYDAMIFSFGAETDRKLEIPGEGLRGSHTATEFVAWYNGRPEYRNRQFDLSGKVAVVIGQGNVAMDVSRILSQTVDELKTTDICQHALEALSKSNIQEVHLIGRRGPAQAAFTAPEIKEFGELMNCVPVLDNPDDMKLNPASQKELEDPNRAVRKKNYDILQGYLNLDASAKKKKIVIHFLESPVEIRGDSRVQKIVLERNKLVGEAGEQKAVGTGVKRELACDLVFRSVGYRGVPIAGLPFDEKKGNVPNAQGRVMDSGKVVAGLYCAGWIKRGPSGVIGTNKPDAEETVQKLLEDVASLAPCKDPNTAKVLEKLTAKKVRVVNFEDWKKIDAVEIANGAKDGKPREKFTSVPEMLKVIQ